MPASEVRSARFSRDPEARPIVPPEAEIQGGLECTRAMDSWEVHPGGAPDVTHWGVCVFTGFFLCMYVHIVYAPFQQR